MRKVRSLLLFAFLPALASLSMTLVPLARAETPVVAYDFTEEAALQKDGVTLENYEFVKTEEDGELSLKPYKLDSVERPDQLVGTVTVPFDGDPGWYTLVVNYQDEPDGVSQFELRVNGRGIHRWTADSIFVTYVARERIEHVRLEPGDEVQIFGRVNSTEYARLRGLRVLPGEPPVEEETVAEVPQRSWSMDLVRLGDFGDYPDPDRLIPSRSGEWGKSKETVYYFMADKPGTFSAIVRPPSRTQFARGSFSVEKVPHGTTGPREKLPQSGTFDSGIKGEGAPLEFQIDEPGLYELHLAGAFEVTSHALTRRIGSAAMGNGFFWVPESTPAIRISGNASGSYLPRIAVKDPTGRIVWQGELEKDGEQTIRVPADQRGQPWYIEYQGVGGVNLTIDGVPPYLTLHRADLLLPREALSEGKPRQVPDAQRLAQSRPPLDPAAAQAGATPVTVMAEGKALAAIVTGASRGEPAGEAAALLQRNLEKIGGAVLPIVKSELEVPPGMIPVLVGTPGDFPDVQVPAGFEALNGGGILLQTQETGGGPRVLVLGKQPDAVRQAVATLLQDLGCRWYYPPRAWHIIPQADTVALALDRMEEPSFIRRTTNGRKANFEEWPFYNRLGSTLNGIIQHSYGQFVPRSLFKDHPEYFALKDTDKDGIGDERVPNQPCTTQPEVIEMFRRGAVDRFREDPALDLLSVSPNDNTYNMCRCETCRAVGSYSDCMWLLAHQVAEAVDEAFDDRTIAVMAYGKPSPPPSLDVPRDERLLAELATEFRNNVTVEEMLEGWPRFVAETTIYDYWAIGQWGALQPGGHYDVAEARKELPMYHRAGAVGVNGEAIGAWASTGLAIYVTARLMWDVDADVDAIVDRYYRDCFGKASPAVRSYEDRWQSGADFNPQTLKAALLDLQRALDLAEHWPEKQRIASLVLYMHTLKVLQDFEQVDQSEQSAESTAALIEAGDSFLWRFDNLGIYHMNNNVRRTNQHGFPWFELDEVEKILEQDLLDLAEIEPSPEGS